MGWVGLVRVIYRVMNSLPTTWSVFLVVAALLCALFAMAAGFLAKRVATSAEKTSAFAEKTSAYAGECADYVGAENKRSQALRRIAELEGTVTELADSYHALLKSHKKLRSRFGMRDLRKRRKEAEDGSGEPESVDLLTPDLSRVDDKQQLRLKAKAAGLLK